MSDEGPIRLVLGSGSPRRAQLLRQLGLEFDQVASDEAEPEPAQGDPAEQAIRCAQAKARAVRELLLADARHPSRKPGRTSAIGRTIVIGQRTIVIGQRTIVIGADTMVIVDGAILGKPADAEEAVAMLRRLAGRRHRVCTGVCLLGPGGREQSDCVSTEVWMRPVTAAAIDAYVASGEPMDKAGAYAIQGLGARFVERINGCYYNVVGLPLARLTAMLDDAGFRS